MKRPQVLNVLNVFFTSTWAVYGQFEAEQNLSDMQEAEYFQNIQHYSTHFKIFSLNVKMIKGSLIEKQ